MSIKSAEKHSKSLIYRAKQTKEREQYNLLSFFNLRYLYSSISIFYLIPLQNLLEVVCLRVLDAESLHCVVVLWGYVVGDVVVVVLGCT